MRPAPDNLLPTLGLVAGLAATLGYAVFWYGGVMMIQWNFCLLALASLGLLYWALSSNSGIAPPAGKMVRWPLLLLLTFVALQMVPLPRVLVGLLSPARVRLAEALNPLGLSSEWIPISIVPGSTLNNLLQIAACAVCFMLVYQAAWRLRDRIWWMIVPLLIIGTFESASGLFQFLTGTSDAQVSGTYANRDHFAGFLEMVLPFSVAYCWTEVRHIGVTNSLSVAWMKILGGAGAAIAMFAAVACSLSRAGFVASVLSIVVLIGCVLSFESSARSKTRAIFVSASAIAAAAAIYLVLASPEQMVSRFTELAVTTNDAGRLDVWLRVLRLIAEYPLVGCGLGGFDSAFLKYNDFAPTLDYDFAHNDYLQVMAELGIVGFVAVATLFCGILSCAVRSARNSDADRKLAAIACIASMSAIALHSFFDFNMYIPANALLLSWISGIAAVPYERRDERRDERRALGAETARTVTAKSLLSKPGQGCAGVYWKQ